MAENAFSFADELGPAKVIYINEPSIALKAILVVDNTAIGPSIGGLRMAPDVSAVECFRLARAMTMKNASAGLRHGGGKSVLFGDPRMPRDKKETLIRALACSLADMHEYIFGPDMGTDEVCMAWIHDEIGRSVGLPRDIGGIPLDELGATGWGLSHATEVAIKYCDFELNGARVAIQGFGSVGKHAARFLTEKGAILVAASDTRGTIYNPEGIDVSKLIEIKNSGKCVNDYPNGEKSGVDAVLDVECDIWIPAARPDVINESNLHRMKTKLIVQGANIPVTAEAEKQLHKKGVLCVPDFIANAGGVICAAMEYEHASEKQAFETIEEKIRRNTELVLEHAKRDQVIPRQAAKDLAIKRIKNAMSFRRWSIF